MRRVAEAAGRARPPSVQPAAAIAIAPASQSVSGHDPAA